MIVRDAEYLVGGEVASSLLEGVISEHLVRAERYKRLKDYYLGKTDVLKRRRAQGLPNNRLSHPFARYIVTVTVGYLVGQGISYKTDESNKEALNDLTELMRGVDIGSVDVENARNAAIYGRGVECLLVNEGKMRVYALNPESAFVVYSDDISHRPLFGVYLTRKTDINGEAVGLRALVCTDKSFTLFEKGDGGYYPVSREAHFFSGVPMVEYWNDENETGDFEWVMSLMDAYDSLQSDRLNDKDQFADKLLVLTGCTLETDEYGRPPWLQLRMDKALCLPDGEARAEFLSGEMDENGNEILRKSLSDDIHKLSLVPDLGDISFAGNISGVAMKYKLMGLEQLTGMKQRWFTEGLKMRLRLMADYMSLTGGRAPEIESVSCVFTRALPENLSETASAIKNAKDAGAMSTRTMVELLHRGSDWDESMIEKEAKEAKDERDSERK